MAGCVLTLWAGPCPKPVVVQALVGKHIAVVWQQPRRWYTGVVTSLSIEGYVMVVVARPALLWHAAARAPLVLTGPCAPRVSVGSRNPCVVVRWDQDNSSTTQLLLPRHYYRKVPLHRLGWLRPGDPSPAPDRLQPATWLLFEPARRADLGTLRCLTLHEAAAQALRCPANECAALPCPKLVNPVR